MIICKCDKIKSFDENNLKSSETIQELVPTIDNIKNIKCPKCYAKSNFSIHGHYNRHILFILKSENFTVDHNVSITRVICNSCGSTHALLPDFVIPYKSFSFNSLFFIIQEVSTSSAYKVSSNLNLSFQFIYSIIATFISFSSNINLLSKEASIFKSFKNFNIKFFSLNCLSICDFDFIKTYFFYYHWLFFMTKFRNVPAPPIYIGLEFD